ncbi:MULTISPECIES: aminofutalosine deaminase family hydrolase [unclassified Helicobacter]|uniref:aminofutalosine deaminase family hydrolase n=1 Tax=unclassified Helicobacter TaxID=2593540 RepID=UPI000CF04ACA|nr:MULTISPECIES: aminofutalosine deaminase family hydrolase [unclassified Helicobacter]
MQQIRVIGASKVFLCNETFDILDNGAIAFGNEILEVGNFSDLSKKYQDAIFYEDCVLLPSFINPHIHFEFSKNTTSFTYGGFDKWLDSVIKNRDEVLQDDDTILQNAIKEQLQSGVGSVGAISSYGQDMLALSQSPLKVLFFNEIIGSNPSAVDFLYSNFLQRLEASKQLASKKFIPSIAIHSPYSVHFILAKKVLDLAKKQDLKTSVHFLESLQEREWLENSSGWFKDFYIKTLGIKEPKSLYEIEEFLNLFEGLDTLFVHCLFANQNELERICSTGSIVTCPRSNRLLNNKLLNLNSIAWNKISIATDGKSSNNNLNFIDELRYALFSYYDYEPSKLSQNLILCATHYSAKNLGLNNGILSPQKDADFSIFEIPNIASSTQEALHFLLHAKCVKKLLVDGVEIKI